MIKAQRRNFWSGMDAMPPHEYDRRVLQDVWRRFCVARKRQRRLHHEVRQEVISRTREEHRFMLELENL